MMSNGDLPRALGARPDPFDARDFRQAALQARVALPTAVDYEQRMTPVKDQLHRGACVSFATVAAKEYQEWKERRWRKVVMPDLSEEFMYSAIQLPGGGAYIRAGVAALAKQGVPRERLMPYRTDVDDSMPPQHNPTKRAQYYATFYRGGVYARLETLFDMKQSLVLNGPFVLGIDWQYYWFRQDRSSDGYPILGPWTDQSVGGHAIAVVGYDDEARCFKIKNSWGAGWGKDGYAWLTYTAVERHLLDAWATVDVAKVDQRALVALIARKDELADRI